MSERDDILKTLVSETLATISGGGNYTTDLLEVRRGLNYFDDFDERPALTVWCREDTVLQHLMGQNQERELEMTLLGYVDNDEFEDYTQLHNLAEDLEYFLYNDFLYKDSVNIDELTFFEGGRRDPMSSFLYRIRIKYYNTI